MKTSNKKSLFLLIGLSAFAVSGCQLWYQLFPPKLHSETEVFTPWAAGDVANAGVKARENADKSKDKLESDLVWQFEAGSISSAEGNFGASEVCFEWAEQLVESQPLPGTRKKIAYALEDELSAALSGDGDLGAAVGNVAEAAADEALSMFDSVKTFVFGGNTYQCGNAERIMLPVYRTWNAFGLKDSAKSAIALKKIENYQRDAKEANLKQLEMDKAAFSSAKLDAETKELEPQMKKIFGGNYASNRKATVEGVYVNPFGYWLNGVYFMNKAEDKADLESASNQMRFAVKASGGKSKILLADAKIAEKAARAGKAPKANIVYVVYEGGTIPKKSEKAVTVRVPPFALALGKSLAVAGGASNPDIPNTGTAYLNTLVSQGAVPALKIAGATLEPVMDFEASANKELLNNAPVQAREAVDEIAGIVIARGRAVLAAKKALKKAAKDADKARGTKKEKEKNARLAAAECVFATAIDNLGKPIVGKHKDCRNWQTLPREICLAKMVAPANGSVKIDGHEVRVPPKGVSIIRVRKVAQASKPMISVFPLKDIVEQEASEE